jgi:hypothetical protein
MSVHEAEPQREVRKYSGRICESESHGRSERYFILGGRKPIILLESSHASPSSPSGKSRVKEKDLRQKKREKRR